MRAEGEDDHPDAPRASSWTRRWPEAAAWAHTTAHSKSSGASQSWGFLEESLRPMRLRAVRGVEAAQGAIVAKGLAFGTHERPGPKPGRSRGGGSSPNASDFSQAPQATPPEHREAGCISSPKIRRGHAPEDRNARPRRGSAAAVAACQYLIGADDLSPRRTWLSVVEPVASKPLSRGILDVVSH